MQNAFFRNAITYVNLMQMQCNEYENKTYELYKRNQNLKAGGVYMYNHPSALPNKLKRECKFILLYFLFILLLVVVSIIIIILWQRYSVLLLLEVLLLMTFWQQTYVCSLENTVKPGFEL